MRVVVYTGAGGLDVIEIVERPDPSPGPGELVVSVQVAGLNPADINQRKGSYPAPAGAPADIPGLEVSGVVSARGEGAGRFELGDRVFGIVGGGGLSERVVVSEAHVARVPDRLDDVQAAAVPEVFVTAHDALTTQGELREGETVLVQGASGGVGSAAIQIARVLGARALGVVRSDDAAELVSGLGALPVRAGDDLVASVRAAAEDGVDLVLETVGAPNIISDLRLLRLRGRIVVIGTGAGSEVESFPLGILMGKRATIRGTVLRARGHEEKAAAVAGFERDVLPALASGELRPVIGEVFEVEHVRDAYARLEGSGKRGKILVRFG